MAMGATELTVKGQKSRDLDACLRQAILGLSSTDEDTLSGNASIFSIPNKSTAQTNKTLTMLTTLTPAKLVAEDASNPSTPWGFLPADKSPIIPLRKECWTPESKKKPNKVSTGFGMPRWPSSTWSRLRSNSECKTVVKESWVSKQRTTMVFLAGFFSGCIVTIITFVIVISVASSGMKEYDSDDMAESYLPPNAAPWIAVGRNNNGSSPNPQASTQNFNNQTGIRYPANSNSDGRHTIAPGVASTVRPETQAGVTTILVEPGVQLTTLHTPVVSTGTSTNKPINENETEATPSITTTEQPSGSKSDKTIVGYDEESITAESSGSDKRTTATTGEAHSQYETHDANSNTGTSETSTTKSVPLITTEAPIVSTRVYETPTGSAKLNVTSEYLGSDQTTATILVADQKSGYHTSTQSQALTTKLPLLDSGDAIVTTTTPEIVTKLPSSVSTSSSTTSLAPPARNKNGTGNTDSTTATTERSTITNPSRQLNDDVVTNSARKSTVNFGTTPASSAQTAAPAGGGRRRSSRNVGQGYDDQENSVSADRPQNRNRSTTTVARTPKKRRSWWTRFIHAVRQTLEKINPF